MKTEIEFARWVLPLLDGLMSPISQHIVVNRFWVAYQAGVLDAQAAQIERNEKLLRERAS